MTPPSGESDFSSEEWSRARAAYQKMLADNPDFAAELDRCLTRSLASVRRIRATAAEWGDQDVS